MKMRNKETGKVQTCDMVVITDEKIDGEIASLNKHTFIFRSIEQFNDEYEAYEPAEPLIKDEKIRKAVRAWAEANELEPDYEVKYDADMYGLNSWQTDINFNYRIDGLEHNEKYTIAELCGEEGE